MIHCTPTLPDPAEETRRRQEHAEAAGLEARELGDAPLVRVSENARRPYYRALDYYHIAANNAATKPEWQDD